jgi:hypothetical protein
LWIKFRDGINKIIEDNEPSKMTKPKFTNPWANTKIDKLCKQQRKAFNKANKTGQQEHKDKYKQIKATAQREIRRAQSNYMQEIINPQLDEKPKSFWQNIKSKKTQKHQEYHPLEVKMDCCIQKHQEYHSLEVKMVCCIVIQISKLTS